MKLFSHRKRPVHLGPYPLERLPRLDDPTEEPRHLGGTRPVEQRPEGPDGASHAFRLYLDLFDAQRSGEVAEPAPIPDDPVERAHNLKAGLYFLDADMVGCAVVPEDAWSNPEARRHGHAVVALVAHTRTVGRGQPGDEWIDGTRQVNADLRAAELAVLTAGYIRRLGFDAVAHTPSATDLDLERVALQCGLIESVGGALKAPYLRGGFALSVVSTEMEIAADAPLAPRGLVGSLRTTRSIGWLLGRRGTRAGIGRLNGDHRPLHMGRQPMERIKRVDEPTTLIIADEVQRVPVRAGGFPRAAHGDLGPKFQNDVKVFAYKTPQAQTYIQQIDAMVPHQDGPVADAVAAGTKDPDRNADAVKALAYHLGGDMVGVCEVPEYVWYSHNGKGEVIEPRHRNAIVILLDQGYETMEGASGDDWVSGAQSMRAYMRGAQIAGIIAEHLRSLGHGARSHTNRDSEVLHIPLVLEAGLGEMSRIGELVLNPFVGPRFKSVVVTTDLPLTPDRKIDFGLQDFCQKCTKCARECPCGAIPFGDKIMFNGYETWKPDVEKCTKYRLGNLKGSACGRCMKTCPFNTEGVLSERSFLWAAIKLPFARSWIARLDDQVGNGSINPVKKWWWDLQWKDGRTIVPEKGTNARGLDPDGGRIADKQRIALYEPDMLPPGDNQGVPVKLDRKEAIRRGERAETPASARTRLARRG
ncbi:MAG: reductive dehalogenase domain-containing protein [Ilumatobacter sp.]|uniref:4Fe-4S dicluster domain-containing protein n=1 Tax=Ilumatobacter sp. TaxID=1967498 RepID=UPI0026361E77|nr:reductive dehalogenase domain-containing protein [Ilumatobacter sp.]MDJ0767353.1 reductive dehalogenase domain-containing protein [Ilumatobacter sp.]